MSLPRRFSYYIVRFFLLVLVVTGLTIQSTSLSHAQSDAYSPAPPTTPLATDDHTRAQSLLIDISSAIICQLVGIDPVDPQKGCVVLDPINHKLTYAPQQNGLPQIGGILGTTSTMIGSLYTKPASTSESVRYLAQNFGIGQHIYAQDNPDNQGFKGLSSLQSTWLIMRNLAYLLLTILFVVIGFAIMIRVHIDPRTVMSIQNQIPKIVVAVIMITFSYAIVGFLIDTMWFFSYVVINTFTTDKTAPSDLKNDLILYEYRDGISAGNVGDVKAKEDAILTQYKGADLGRFTAASQATLKDVDDYETGCNNIPECKNKLDITKIAICKNIPNCSGSLREIFLAISDNSLAQLVDSQKVADEAIADHLYADFVKYSTSGVSLSSIIDQYSDNNSLRQQLTLHLNSNPLVFLNGALSWGGGITDHDGIVGLSTSVASTLGDVIARTITGALGLDTSDCPGFTLRFWNYANCAKNILQSTIKWVATVFTILIILAAIFIALLKVWFNLLRALVYVVIYTVIGPLMIVIGLFPGSPYSFSRWIRALLAHLMVFPATIFVFVLARIMASNTASNNPQGTSFLPPLIVNTNTFDNFGLLVAFGLILITPEVLNWVRAAFNAKPGPVGGVIAGGFLAGKQLASGPTRWGLGRAFRPQGPNQSIGFARKFLIGGVNDGGGFRRRIIKPIVGSFSPNEVKPVAGH
ncbi:MAG: type IV secretion system protein [Patescibacteria group bacterium]